MKIPFFSKKKQEETVAEVKKNTVLYITAHAMDEENSTSMRASRKFIEEYQAANPNDEIKEINLYKDGVTFLSAEDITKMFSNQDSRVMEMANEFAAADKYIIASPMWNLGTPAILKAYMDYVSYVGITFKYTENGPVGLLEDKKALYILSTGGFYSPQEMQGVNFAKNYMETILGFFGIQDVQTMMLEATNAVDADTAKANYETFENELVELAKKF